MVDSVYLHRRGTMAVIDCSDPASFHPFTDFLQICKSSSVETEINECCPNYTAIQFVHITRRSCP